MATKASLNSRYRSIFDTSLDAIIVINTRGIIKDVNPAMLKLFEYNRDELIGQNVSMLMGEPYHHEHDQYLKNYQETRKAKIIGIGREVEARKSSGYIFPMRLAVSEFVTEEGTFYTGVIHDLSEEYKVKEQLHDYTIKLEQKVKDRTKSLEKEVQLKEHAQKALIASQKLYETIAENFPNGTISVLNPQLDIVFIKGAELLEAKFNTDKLIGKNYIPLLPDAVQETFKDNFKQVLDGKFRMFEIEEGDKVYLARMVPLFDEDGHIHQVLNVEINITPQKKAEEEVHSALKKEKQLNELKSRFVSMASHEFRTPLSSILSSASLIEKYPELHQQEKRTRHVQKIKSNVQNLNLILNDFLSLEKIEGGIIKNKPMLFSLSEFVIEVVEETSSLQKVGQEVKTTFEHSTDEINLDPFLLRNILNNLISNAYKYSPVNSEIQIATRQNKNELTLSIKDQGIGIADAEQENLFQVFYRASNAGNIQGTGLGLNIVKRYSDIMGAEINFESTLNKGSIFTIKFPLNG